MHPRVASALNELGGAALRRQHYDEAIARFTRVVEIYRTLYHDKHYLIGLALSNLASVYIEKKDYARAEQLFHEAIRRYSETLPPNHMFIGIAHIKLGRTLVRERRYADAEPKAWPVMRSSQTGQSIRQLAEIRTPGSGDDYEILASPRRPRSSVRAVASL